MARNFASSSVSSDTFTRRTPASASGRAKRSSWLPLVVSVSSSSPVPRWRDIASKNVMMPLRTSGSPPVMRSLRTPMRTKAEHRRSSSSSVRSSRRGRNVMCSDMQ